MTASADRISPRAAGSLNACLSATTPSGSPSNALAIPRGTGRSPFSTSRSHPGTCPGAPGSTPLAVRLGAGSSVPDTFADAMRATVSGPSAPAVKPVSAMVDPSGGRLGMKSRNAKRGRPRRTTMRDAAPAFAGSSASAYDRRESA